VIPGAVPQLPGPWSVSSRDVEAVRDTARQLAAIDFRQGGMNAQIVAGAALDRTRELLGARCPVGLKPALQSAVADVAHTAGFAAFDAGEYDVARERWRLALACADAAGDSHLVAQALASEARQEVWVGRPDPGLAYLDRALEQPGLTQLEIAMLQGIRARALAIRGDVRGTLEAMRLSETHLERSAAQPVVEHLVTYTPAIHAGNVCHALSDLVTLHGRIELAEQAAFKGLLALDGDVPDRHRAFVLSVVATTMMFVDPEEAAATGRQALVVAQGVRSDRLSVLLWRLDAAATPREGIVEVAELRELIPAVACA
jgi:hypothetical protein